MQYSADALLEVIAEGAHVFDLSHPMFVGMPQSPNHPQFRLALQRRHGDVIREDGSSAASDLMVLGTHVGTHIDALCHVSFEGRLHGGSDVEDAQRGGRFNVLGVETVQPMVCRGLLLDIPAVLGRESCAPAYEITPSDLEAALGLTGAVPTAGDVLLVRSGWSRQFVNGAAYVGRESGVPGVGEEGARWLAGHRPKAVGADTIAFECLTPGAGHALLPAHRLLLVDEGIYIIEALALEELAAAGLRRFLFILAPLRLVGGTGSPVRPLAVAGPAPVSPSGS